jgi:hypothetical protein
MAPELRFFKVAGEFTRLRDGLDPEDQINA